MNNIFAAWHSRFKVQKVYPQGANLTGEPKCFLTIQNSLSWLRVYSIILNLRRNSILFKNLLSFNTFSWLCNSMGVIIPRNTYIIHLLSFGSADLSHNGVTGPLEWYTPLWYSLLHQVTMMFGQIILTFYRMTLHILI